MKKVLSLVIVLVMAMSLFMVAPVALAAEASAIKIGMVTPDADHGFTGESVAHARAELEQLKADGKIADYKFEVGGEASLQIAAVEAILQWQPDVFVLWPLEGDQLRNAAQTIVDAGVPLIVYDRLIDGFVPTAEVMGDNVLIGQMMGDYLLQFFAEELGAGEEITYLRFIGDSSTVSVQRSGGMDEKIAASEYAGKFVQLEEDYLTNWSNATAMEQMENWLNTAPADQIAALDLIVTHDDEVVDGVVIALQNYEAANPGVLTAQLMTGVGGRRETLATFDNPVANGIELDTYFFSPSFIREAIRVGVAAAAGEQYNGADVTGQILIPTIEINKDTVEAFRASVEFIERYSIAE